MRLSRLQRYILTCVLEAGGKCDRKRFERFYADHPKPPSHDDQINAITKALERLIDKEFLVGYGVRTREKWYIKEVRLTLAGRRTAKKLRGEQQVLNLKR